MCGIKSQVFWCSISILRPLFDLRWSWRSWPPDINDLWRSKYEINENGSCEVSNHRFFVVPIPFWDPFITSDGPGGRVPIPFWDPFLISDDYEGLDLQILMTSGGLTMTMLMGHFIYHCFSESNPKHIFESEGPKCLWSREVKIQNHWTVNMDQVRDQILGFLLLQSKFILRCLFDFKWI